VGRIWSDLFEWRGSVPGSSASALKKKRLGQGKIAEAAFYFRGDGLSWFAKRTPLKMLNFILETGLSWFAKRHLLVRGRSLGDGLT